MNKGHAPPSVRLNVAPGPPWRTYSQRAQALNIPLRPTKPTSSDDLVIPTRAVAPFAYLSLNASVPKPNQQMCMDTSSEADFHGLLHNDPFPSPVASEGDVIVPVSSSEIDELDGTPTKPQVLPHHASGHFKSKNKIDGNSKRNNEINLALSSKADGLEVTPAKPSVWRLQSGAKKNEIDLAGSSEAEAAHATPKGRPQPLEVARMHQLRVEFTLFLQKGAEPPKGSAKAKKPTYTPIPLPSTQILFDTQCITITALKNRLFLIASEIDPTDDEKKGNTAILKGADAQNLVKILGIVKGHDRFGKGKYAPIKTNTDVVQFFSAVRNCPQKESGFTITMENPQKAVQEAEDAILKKKARLRAQNEMDNVPTTAVDIARCVPEDQEDLHLKALQLRHSSMKTGKNKGYRLFNRKDHSLKMDIGFRQLLIWAEYLAQEIEGVTIDIPPKNHPEFVWKDINPKQPMLSTPLPKTKRSKVKEPVAPFKKVEEPVAPFKMGSYDEMQGTHILVNYDTLHSIRHLHNIEDYLRYCNFGLDAVKEIATILMAYGVTGFKLFLYPDVMNVRDIQSWGISWTSAMELFTHPRRFYQSVIDHQQILLDKGKMKARDSPQFNPGPIASTSAVPQGSSMASASTSAAHLFYSQEI